MAEPPWPPPDDERPYDQEREQDWRRIPRPPRPQEEEWGGEPNWLTFFALTGGLILVLVAIYLLLSTH